MSKTKTLLYGLIVVMVAGIGFGLVRHSRLQEEPGGQQSVLPDGGDVSLNRIHHVATRGGVKEWTLDAESAQYEKAGNKTVFKDVAATFFFEDGKAVSLSSRSGMLLTDTGDMEVWGGVVARSDPYQLNTERMGYEQKSQVLSTKTPIVIKGNGLQITGDRMTLDLQTKQVVVWGEVKAVFERLQGLNIED
jgi:LPS export ABC transporter protein LptC